LDVREIAAHKGKIVSVRAIYIT